MTSKRAPSYLKLLLFLFVVYLCHTPTCCIEPITIGVSLFSVGAGFFGKDFLKSQTYCRFYECCDDRSVPANIGSLAQTLSTKLFGQHIVQQYVIAALNAHLRSNSPSRKPLLMSFHGTPGTGKSFVADKIAEAMYLEGTKSKYVHRYLGRADFSHPERVREYKERIKREVRESIAECPYSLFIFDEVDKMPPGIFDMLTSLVDYAGNDKSADYTKAIFIFLSNTAGVRISDHLAALMKKGKRREDTRLSDFEEMLKISAYNTEGGLKMTNLIEAHVIDHYVPFLALEKAHIVKCVEEEFRNWLMTPEKELVDKVINSAVVYEPVHSMFGTSGCKTIEKKVAMLVEERRQNFNSLS